MLKRNVRSEFAGGVHVFPGGAVDAADRGRVAEEICCGRTEEEACGLLGVREGGLAYWVAALRECFEEAGVLVAYGPALSHEGHRQLIDLAGMPDEQRFAGHRIAVIEKRLRFLDVCAEEGLQLAVDRVHYFAHWITPVGVPRRYDTRFFVTKAPTGQTAAHDTGETVEHVWTTPDQALRRHREGEIELVFPTIRSLQAIKRFSTTAELIAAAAAAADSVPTVEPRVVVESNGVRILLPGDPGYEDAPLAEPPDRDRDPDEVNETIRAISRAANEGPGGGPAPSGPLTAHP